MLAGIVILITG
jgi:hypothetical protein